ncbi:hypothetical protein WJX77_007709 [Trebouxia sp. C0004]
MKIKNRKENMIAVAFLCPRVIPVHLCGCFQLLSSPFCGLLAGLFVCWGSAIAAVCVAEAPLDSTRKC